MKKAKTDIVLETKAQSLIKNCSVAKIMDISYRTADTISSCVDSPIDVQFTFRDGSELRYRATEKRFEII